MKRVHLRILKVGVGDGDMGAMIQLDSDKARLHSKGDQAARDIVQFVRECLAQQQLSHSSKQFELNIYFIPRTIFADLNTYLPCGSLDPADFQHELEAPRARLSLARAVLQEIPRQVVSFLVPSFFLYIFLHYFCQSYWTLTVPIYVFLCLCGPFLQFLCVKFHSNHVTGQKEICLMA